MNEKKHRIKDKFSATSEPKDRNLEELREESLYEARDKEERYRNFIQDPFNEDRPWWNARFAFDYFKMFVGENEYRKDGFTQESLHVLNPLLRMKGQLTGPKKPEDIILPRFVERQIVNYEAVIDKLEEPVFEPLPKSMQSIERIFVAETTHDLCENYPEVTTDKFRDYMKTRIEKDAPKDIRFLLLAELEEDCRALDALTFGKKIRKPDGSIEKIKTHDGDTNSYRRAMESVWAAIAVKGPDRTDGLETRFSKMKSPFAPDKNQTYLSETNALFLHPRPLESMKTRYPDLANYFEIMNAKMDVAYRALHVFVEYHPKLERGNRKLGRPETADVRFDRSPAIAARDLPYLEPDLHSWPKMLENLRYESQRHPILKPLYEQIETQLKPYLTPPYKPVPKKNIILILGRQSGDSHIWTHLHS